MVIQNDIIRCLVILGWLNNQDFLIWIPGYEDKFYKYVVFKMADSLSKGMAATWTICWELFSTVDTLKISKAAGSNLDCPIPNEVSIPKEGHLVLILKRRFQKRDTPPLSKYSLYYQRTRIYIHLRTVNPVTFVRRFLE